MKTAALAAGASLLVSEKLSVRQRRSIGAALIGFAVASTTIARVRSARRTLAIERDRRLIGATRFARKGDDDFTDERFAADERD